MQEVLQYALEFAHSRPEGVDVANVSSRGDNVDCLAHDVDMESPKSQARYVCDHPGLEGTVTVSYHPVSSSSSYSNFYVVDVRLHVARSYASSPDWPFSFISSLTLSNHLLLGLLLLCTFWAITLAGRKYLLLYERVVSPRLGL